MDFLLYSYTKFLLLTKFIRYTLRTLAIIIGIFFLLYIIGFIYVSINKKSIIKQVTEEIGKKINGKVAIGDVELSFFRTFPKVSVLLRSVSITDTMFQIHHHAIFEAKDVFAQLSVMELVKKEFPVNGLKIEHASVYLFTDTSGYTNAYLLKPKSNATKQSNNTTGKQKNNLESIELKDVHVTIDDKKKEKLHDILVDKLKIDLSDNEDETIFYAKANMLINNLAFNLPAGSYVKGKKFEGDFRFRLDKKLQQLQFDSINIKLDEQPFNITAAFDLVKPDPQFSLRVHTRQVLFDFAKSLLTKKISTAVSIVGIDTKMDMDADINGPLNGGDPFIIVNWKVKGAHLSTPVLDFDDASFIGYYTNEVVKGQPRRDPNSIISVRNFSATWNALPFSSEHIEILNLTEPLLTCDLTANFPLTTLNETVGSNAIQFESGNGSINLTYKGRIDKNTNTNSFINGNISFINGNLLYTPRNVEMKNINGQMAIKNSDVLIENIQCNVLNNKITMDGKANNLISLINTEPDKVNIDWNIYSPSLNLTGFTYLLKSRAKIAAKPVSGKLGKLATGIDNVLDESRLHVNLKTPRFTYKKFVGSNAVASITLLNDRYELNNLSMDQGGGNINLTGSLVTVKDNYHQAKANVTLTNLDVSKLFEAFNNFGQNGIEARNLEGKLTATVNADLSLDNEGKADPNTVHSLIDFSLKQGALNNYEPIKKIQSFIFKKRDFDNIRFAELKDHLEVNDQEIKISRMEIESSVLSMFIEGVYSMKGNTNLSIQVPFSNLKKRDSSYIPVNGGVDRKVGASLYIKGVTGSDGNVQFKPEIFRLFKKSK